MHEEQLNSNGPINAIGWDWDTASGTFSCPPDKLKAACSLISEWSSRCLSEGAFSINEIEKLVGLQRWVSTACPVIVPSVAYLQAFGFSISKARGSAPLDRRAAEAVHFLHAFFTSWDGRCPISAGFSPVYCYEFLIRSDASTDDGCGGFCLPFTPGACGFFACFMPGMHPSVLMLVVTVLPPCVNQLCSSNFLALFTSLCTLYPSCMEGAYNLNVTASQRSVH